MTIQTCEDLDDAVAEYLEYRRFPNTLECFRSEIRHRKLLRDRLARSDELLPDCGGCQSRRSLSDDDGHGHGAGESRRTRTGSIALFRAFDHGDMSGFLSAWSAITPKSLLRREASSSLAREVRVVEFLSCVHCAVFPFRAAALAEAAGPREASVACAKSMSSFRRYLDRAALPYDDDHELVGFYALPHVPDPSAQPAFEALFDDAWSAGLRTRIEGLIGKVSQWRRSDPLLVRLLLRRQDQVRAGRSLLSSSSALEFMPRIYSKIQQPPLHDDCDYDAPGKAATARTQETPHSYGVVGQSSSYGGSNQVSGQAGGGGPARRKIAYSDGSSSSVAEGAEEGGPEKTKGERQQQQQEHRPRLLRSNSDRAILGRVDYNAVKRDLRKLAGEVADDRNDIGHEGSSAAGNAAAAAAIDASLLLQTVRWRFAHAPPGKTRRGVLYHLIRNDIFDLRSEGARGGGGGEEEGKTATTLLEVLLRLVAPSSSSSALASSCHGGAPPVTDAATQSKEAGGGGNRREASSTKGDKAGWEEFGGDPGRLVAEYTARLLSALVSMSKARSYVLGERCAGTILLLADTLKGEDFQETGLAKRLLAVLARLSRRQPAQEAIAVSCFVDWAGKMLGSHFSQGAGSRDPCPLFLRRTTEILGNVAAGTASGRTAALAATPDLLGSLGNLLEHKDGQVRSNAVLCLTLLLRDREGRERALATGMDAVLQDLRSRKAGHDDHAFTQDIGSLLDMLGGKLYPDEKPDTVGRQHDGGDGGRGGNDVDVEDFDSLSDDESCDEASVVSYFVQATKAPCGEKLLRERYRLSTAEAKEEAVTGSSGGRPPWGGEEEELVCGGGHKTKKRGGIAESKEADDESPRSPTPEAGTATLIRGEEKVYDSRRPGLPEEMQSRPRIPRTPAGSAPIPRP
ncbi:unnamed protein product, partial [Pylaiella littoralis]